MGKFTMGDDVIRQKEDSFGEYGVILDSGTDLNVLPCSMT